MAGEGSERIMCYTKLAVGSKLTFPGTDVLGGLVNVMITVCCNYKDTMIKHFLQQRVIISLAHQKHILLQPQINSSLSLSLSLSLNMVLDHYCCHR